MRSRNSNPIEAVPGKDVFNNVVNPGDTIAMATKSYGSVTINKGRYLGQRKAKSYNHICYVVEQDRVHSRRMNADGVEWDFSWRGSKVEEQNKLLEAAIGSKPISPTIHRYSAQIRHDPKLLEEVNLAWKNFENEYYNYEIAKKNWLDANYPYKNFPYVRRSTLWLNKIIKL